ncbi:MAG: hypothetical protein ACRENU_15050 [Gemmatimonadaceae bacterium]
MEPLPPGIVIGIIATVAWAAAAVVLGLPLVRAWTRRMEQREGARGVPADVSARLARIEAAVESIAIEVERISENQRYLTKLQAQELPAGSPTQRDR